MPLRVVAGDAAAAEDHGLPLCLEARRPALEGSSIADNGSALAGGNDLSFLFFCRLSVLTPVPAHRRHSSEGLLARLSLVNLL